jgi:hypothetical protein
MIDFSSFFYQRQQSIYNTDLSKTKVSVLIKYPTKKRKKNNPIYLYDERDDYD